MLNLEKWKCTDCRYAETDYEEYYGGYKRYFICGCMKDWEPDKDGECEKYREDKSYYENW